MGMQGGSGKGGGFNTGQFGGFDPFPIGPVGGRTSGKANTGMVGGFSDIQSMPPRPSLQQQYAGLNAGVRGFEPLGIRGYTPPVYAQPMQAYGGFNPFGFNSFQGNPFRNPRRLPFLGPVTPPIQPALPSQVPNFNNAFGQLPLDAFGQLPMDASTPPKFDQLARQDYERQEMENYQAPPTYETQVVQGGRDIVNRIDPPVVQPVEPVTQPIQTPQPSLSRQDYERLEMGPNINVGKAGGGRVQGFAEGGMPEENQTGERLEEETIMALMGKHPNPKEVFTKYLQVYGEEGLMALAAEVEQMMSSQGRMIDGPGGGVDDFVPAIIDNMQPAALSKDEYVIPADVVAHAGDGSSEAGGKKFDQLVSRVRKTKTGNTTQPEQIEFEEEIQQIT